MGIIPEIETYILLFFMYTFMMCVGSGYLSAAILIHYAMKYRLSSTDIQHFWDKTLLLHLRIFHSVVTKSNSFPTPVQSIANGNRVAPIISCLIAVFIITVLLFVNGAVISDSLKGRATNPFFAFIVLPVSGLIIFGLSLWNTLKIRSVNR